MQQEQKLSFLCIGLSPGFQTSLTFDHFTEGEVNRSSQCLHDASGKCINVCRVLSQAGADAHVVTVVGKESRRELEELCRRDGLSFCFSETDGKTRTCTTIIDQTKGVCTELVANEHKEISPSSEEAFRTLFLQSLAQQQYDGVIISGSKIPGFSSEIIPFMVQWIKSRGITLYADYRGEDLKASCISREIRPDVIKINEQEFLSSFPEERDLDQGVRRLSEEYGNIFIVSRGAGKSLYADRGVPGSCTSKQIKALNPIGSGDAMMAGIAISFSAYGDCARAVEKGNEFGAKNAQLLRPGRIQP